MQPRKISWVDHINIHYWDHFTLTNAELAQWLFIRRSIGHRGMLLAGWPQPPYPGFFLDREEETIKSWAQIMFILYPLGIW